MAEFAVVLISQNILDFARLTDNLHIIIIPYQLTKFQAFSSNNFLDILLTSLKCPIFKGP